MFTVNFLHDDNKFTIEQGSLEYISTLSPRFEWERRGFKASKYDIDDAKNTQAQIEEKLQNEIRDSEFQEELDSFKQKSLSIYNHLKNGHYRKAIGPLSEKEVYFIIGVPRTGGTYILRELLEIIGVNIQNYNNKMIGDKVPTGKWLVNFSHNKQTYRRGIFALAQWLCWSREEMTDLDYVIKKHITFGQILPLLDSVFKDKANYLITHRHPGEAHLSYLERFGPDPDFRKSQQFRLQHELWWKVVSTRTNIDKSEWRVMSSSKNFLYYWASTYLEIANQENLKGQLKLLNFGSDHKKFVSDFKSGRKDEYSPRTFSPSDREIENFWKTKKTKSIIQRVSQAWSNRFDSDLSLEKP